MSAKAFRSKSSPIPKPCQYKHRLCPSVRQAAIEQGSRAKEGRNSESFPKSKHCQTSSFMMMIIFFLFNLFLFGEATSLLDAAVATVILYNSTTKDQKSYQRTFLLTQYKKINKKISLTANDQFLVKVNFVQISEKKFNKINK